MIPRLRNEPRRGVRFDRAAYRTRNRIERLINRLKQFRAVATRYDKLTVRFHATVTLAAIRLWLRVCKQALRVYRERTPGRSGGDTAWISPPFHSPVDKLRGADSAYRPLDFQSLRRR